MQCSRKLWTALLLIVVFSLVTLTASAGELIFGLGALNAYTGYFVDPNTGQTTIAGSGLFGLGASSSPFGGRVFVDTGINLWISNVFNSQNQWLGSLFHERFDLAFDPTTNTLYGLGDGIYQLDYADCLVSPCLPIPDSQVGVFPGGVQAVDFVPGYGLFGADLNGDFWLFNPSTGDTSFFRSTGILGISDIAFDYELRRFIVSAAGPKCFTLGCGPTSGTIWSVDPGNGSVVLLNDNAPPIWGMAEVTPEPSTVVLLLSGFGLVARAVKRRLR